jgi:hypothetical protein
MRLFEDFYHFFRDDYPTTKSSGGRLDFVEKIVA